MCLVLIGAWVGHLGVSFAYIQVSKLLNSTGHGDRARIRTDVGCESGARAGLRRADVTEMLNDGCNQGSQQNKWENLSKCPRILFLRAMASSLNETHHSPSQGKDEPINLRRRSGLAQLTVLSSQLSTATYLRKKRCKKINVYMNNPIE